MYPETTNILVVVDEAEARRAIVRTLRGEGFAVAEAADGFSAIRAAGQQRFALAIAATRLPGTLDGAVTLKHIRARQPQLKALLTGSAADRPASIGGDGDDFIAAPFRMRDLLGGVFELLERDPARGRRAG